MRSTKRISIAVIAAVLVTGVVVGSHSIASGSDSGDSGIPRINVEGSRDREFTSLDELAGKSCAIAVVTPTGKQHSVPLPAKYGGTKDSAPTPYITMRVSKVLSGSLGGTTIELVSPGIDENTGKQALLSGGPYLVFLAPAMYEADQPIEGYVAVGGPAGVFAASTSSSSSFSRVDNQSQSLPGTVTPGKTRIPVITKSEQTLLHEGP